MSKNFFTFLMILVIGVGFWMGGKFLYNLHRYFLLSEVTTANLSQWEVKEYKPEKFIIAVDFEFQVGERTVYQHFDFSKPVYQNPYLPAALIEKWENESWQVWYNPKNPELSSLQKVFPIKAGVYFILCLGVFLYFAWLRVYVRKLSGDLH